MPDQPTLPPTPEDPSSDQAHTLSADSPLEPPAEDPYEGAVPPGYDWPTHGGYLGCLCGMFVSFLVFGLIGANLFSYFWASGKLSGPLFILLCVVAFFALAYGFGRAGYVLGKRFYRAYPEKPGDPHWGEDESVRIEAGEGEAMLADERTRMFGRIGSFAGGAVGAIITLVVAIRLFDALGVGTINLDSLNTFLIGIVTWVSFVVFTFVVGAAAIYFLGIAGRKLLTRGSEIVPTTTPTAEPAPNTSPPA